MRVVSLTLTRKSQYHLLLVCRFLLVRGVGLLGFRVSENFLQARAVGTRLQINSLTLHPSAPSGHLKYKTGTYALAPKDSVTSVDLNHSGMYSWCKGTVCTLSISKYIEWFCAVWQS